MASSSSDDDTSRVVKKKATAKIVRHYPKRHVRTELDQLAETPSVIDSDESPVTTEGLDGNYWSSPPAKPPTIRIDLKSTQDDDSSSSDDTSSTSAMTSSDEDSDVLFERNTFVTCRSPSDTFYLCQVLSDVRAQTKKIPIRWCSVIGEDGDDTKVSINTRFKLSYTDKLDPNAILIAIPSVVTHAGGVLSLKKQDIVESKRILTKSIRGEPLSSDDMMDLSTESPTKKKATLRHIHFSSSDASTSSVSDASSTSSSDSSAVSVPDSKKRKKAPKKKPSKKQPPKKRPRKATNARAVPRARKPRQRKVARDDGNGSSTTKKTKATKPVRVPKTQLFKVHSNRSLTPNAAITVYPREPFFEDSLVVPYISSYAQGKLAIRAVLTNDAALLKSLINDTKRVFSVHVTRGLFNEQSAIHYAIEKNNLEMVRMLLDDMKTPKKNRCPPPDVTMVTQSTGQTNTRMLGFRTARIMASRGAKEGNNALNKDSMTAISHDNNAGQIIWHALKNNCSREMYDLLFKALEDFLRTQEVYENIYKIVIAGHRQLAASIIGDIKANAFYGFNALHHQVLLYDNEDITINRATSVMKKTQSNSSITPIHCAAINPNAKYLKTLLKTMPEYNILDHYERRPIHFAAACEGSDPLEFLLSKQVSLNDVDRGGNSPLHIAAMNGRAANVELLLRTAKDKSATMDAEDRVAEEKFGLACINRMNKSRFYPLHLAVLNNHLDCVKILLDYEAPIDMVTSAALKLTPLMMACQKGHLEVVKYLISKGARAEARDRFQRTPLIHACMCGNAHIVSYLLHLGANANVFDSSMNTALHYAIAYGWYFCVRALLEAGANVNCVNAWQTTCLAAGFLKGHYGLCDYLLTDHGADINFKTEDGLTLVMLSVQHDLSASVVEQLEYVVGKHGADCTTADANGNNAFHYLAANLSDQNNRYTEEKTKEALRENYFKIAQILINHNCDADKLNSKQQSPLMIALQAGNFILVDYLIERAKVSITADISFDGRTLLHYFAQKCERFDLTQMLLKLPVTDEMKKMGQVYDNTGRTPFHHCAAKFDKFCQKFQLAKSSDRLKKIYQSIAGMIEYCLVSAACDPDAPIKLAERSKASLAEDRDGLDDETVERDEDAMEVTAEEDDASEADDADDEDEDGEKPEKMDEGDDDLAKTTDQPAVELKETSVFSLLRTVPFIDSTAAHPLQAWLKNTKNVNVLHHKNRRTPLLEAIHLRQSATAQLLIEHSACDINLPDERQQAPLMYASRLQLLPVVRRLLEHDKCNVLLYDNKKNQAIHYFLRTSDRTSEHIDILNSFIDRLSTSAPHALNSVGNHQRTPLHVAVYHNSGTIDAITNIEKLLIENGGDLMKKDELGNIPLHNVFLSKNVGDDPVELCVLLLKEMRSKGVDTPNNEGNTPLHLAVEKCSTVCVALLQQHHARLTAKNHLAHSVIDTCVISGHLNLFITFLQQAIDIDMGALHQIRKSESTGDDAKRSAKEKSKEQAVWKWQYSETADKSDFLRRSLMYLIVERDWQGALALILNEIDRFHLSYIQIIETAVLNKKLNLVLRLLLRVKDEMHTPELNAEKRNLFHLIANADEPNEQLLKQILAFLLEYKFDWNTPDTYGCYPLHYACVKRNFVFLQCLREHFPRAYNLAQTDASKNTAVGLLFWSAVRKTNLPQDKLRTLVTSAKQLDCLCNYDNAIAREPLSFGTVSQQTIAESYPPTVLDTARTSPLINAIVHNNFDLVKFLLELGANVNFPDANKQTPLMHAVRQNNIDLVKLLLNKDYSLDDEEQAATTQVFHRRGRQPVKKRAARFFLGATADNSDDEAPAKNKPATFQKTSPINLDATDSDGRTCIHHLADPFAQGSYRSSIEIVQLLHSCGASLTEVDDADYTPLKYAAEKRHQALYEELARLIPRKTAAYKASYEPVLVSDPNAALLQKPDFYGDAEQLIDAHIRSHPASSHNAAYKIDPASGMSSIGEVVIDTDKNEPYDVRLTKIDVTYGIYGMYNFYRMQIIRHKSKTNLYFLFTHWGRIGDREGQHQLTPFSTLEECQKEFLSIFRSKTGNAWKDTDQFAQKPKKYTLVKLSDREIKKHADVPIDFDRLQPEQELCASKLRGAVYQTVMRTIVDRRAIRATIRKTALDVSWMPVSQLKREMLEEACALLAKIREILVEQGKVNVRHVKTPEEKEAMREAYDLVYQYTNKFYTLVPQNGFADEKLAVLHTEDAVKRQERIVNDLMELELTYKILLGAQANVKTISPLDYVYSSINCRFEAMNKNDIDSQLILRYIWASETAVQVEQIFKIARPNEDERLRKRNLNNHYLLWHGTNICNLISILTRGLLVGPMAARATGSLFGTGIYTADLFKKSLGYCSGVQQSDGERCFMLLCEVALGNVKEVGNDQNREDDEEEEEDDDDHDGQLDLSKYQSRKGIGRQIPDPKHTIVRNDGVHIPLGQLIDNETSKNGCYYLNYNEYIVYDEAQVALRYLVQFRQ